MPVSALHFGLFCCVLEVPGLVTLEPLVHAVPDDGVTRTGVPGEAIGPQAKPAHLQCSLCLMLCIVVKARVRTQTQHTHTHTHTHTQL